MNTKPMKPAAAAKRAKDKIQPLPGAARTAMENEPLVTATTFGREKVILRLAPNGRLYVERQ